MAKKLYIDCQSDRTAHKQMVAFKIALTEIDPTFKFIDREYGNDYLIRCRAHTFLTYYDMYLMQGRLYGTAEFRFRISKLILSEKIVKKCDIQYFLNRAQQFCTVIDDLSIHYLKSIIRAHAHRQFVREMAARESARLSRRQQYERSILH